MKNFLIGAQLYSVRTLTQTEDDLRNTLKSIKAMGYNTCQLSGQSREIPDEAVRDMLTDTGVKCIVTHNPMTDFTENIDALVRRHKMWNCKYAGIGGMPAEYRGSAEGFKKFTEDVNKVAERLRDEGITFVYHNHAFEFARFDGTLGMDILFDGFNDNAQFLLDVYWAQAGGADPVEWVYKVNGRMDVAHFKDMRGSNDFNPHCIMTPVGEGNLNWPKLIKACEDTGVMFVEVEQDNAVNFESPLSQLETSLNNLKKMGCSF